MASKSPPEPTYTATSLHQKVVEAVSDYFHPTLVDELDETQIEENEYETFIIGKFVCANKKCRNNGWTSGHVSIRIWGYPGNGYRVVVYNQRCKHCKKLGELTMNETSFVERVSYRLKKWAGIQMEVPPHTDKETPPHRRELCEGCKQGRCEVGMMSRQGHSEVGMMGRRYGYRSFYH